MASESEWRRRANAAIVACIGNAVFSNEKEMRFALRDAYPFGPRQHHPYKIWLDCVKKAVERRFPRMVKENEEPRYIIGQSLFIDVNCPWCTRTKRFSGEKSGCLICGKLVDALANWFSYETFAALVKKWRSFYARDNLALLICADWLEEHGEDLGLAELFRKVADVAGAIV